MTEQQELPVKTCEQGLEGLHILLALPVGHPRALPVGSEARRQCKQHLFMCHWAAHACSWNDTPPYTVEQSEAALHALDMASS